MDWGWRSLADTNDRGDLYFVGLGEKDGGMNSASDDSHNLTSENSSVDFALLASCNETISSRGTYTIWTAAYAKGRAITEFNYYQEMGMEGP